jgi:hypothetical protein
VLEEMVLHQNVTEEELTRLQFHTHRLAIVASPAVLKEYQYFLDVFHAVVQGDKHVSIQDANQLSGALAKLTVFIRADLVGELDVQSGHSARQIRDQILTNARN